MKLAFQLCVLFAVTSFLVRGASLPEGKLARAQRADEEPEAAEDLRVAQWPADGEEPEAAEELKVAQWPADGEEPEAAEELKVAQWPADGEEPVNFCDLFQECMSNTEVTFSECFDFYKKCGGIFLAGRK